MEEYDAIKCEKQLAHLKINIYTDRQMAAKTMAEYIMWRRIITTCVRYSGEHVMPVLGWRGIGINGKKILINRNNHQPRNVCYH